MAPPSKAQGMGPPPAAGGHISIPLVSPSSSSSSVLKGTKGSTEAERRKEKMKKMRNVASSPSSSSLAPVPQVRRKGAGFGGAPDGPPLPLFPTLLS